MSDLAPKRRWLRFSLRTLFVVVTLLACWLGYYGRWAYMRRTARAWIESHRYVSRFPDWTTSTPASFADNERLLPWTIRLFGEEPLFEITVARKGDDPTEYAGKVEQLRALFPEASVVDVSRTEH